MKPTTLALVALLGSALSLPAATLAVFADGTNTTPTLNKASTVSGLTTSALTGAGLTGTGGSTTIAVRDAFGTALYITGSSPTGAGTTAGNFWAWSNNQNWGAGAPDSANHYFQFSLSADPGNTLSLQNLAFNWQTAINNQTSTATFAYQLYYSTDGTNFTSIGSQGSKAVGNGLGGSTTDWGTLTNENIDLSSIQGASNVTFRLGMAGTGTSTGSFAYFFQNLTVNGDVVAVPEPSVLLLGGLGLLGLLRRRR